MVRKTWKFSLDEENHEILVGYTKVVLDGVARELTWQASRGKWYFPFMLGSHSLVITDAGFPGVYWGDRELYVDGYDIETGKPFPVDDSLFSGYEKAIRNLSFILVLPLLYAAMMFFIFQNRVVVLAKPANPAKENKRKLMGDDAIAEAVGGFDFDGVSDMEIGTTTIVNLSRDTLDSMDAESDSEDSVL